MPKFVLFVLLTLASTLAAAQPAYVYRAEFLCIDGDSCNVATAVENRYPESALFVNVTRIDGRLHAITVGKDWSANETPISFYDTSFNLRLGDTAYFYDANNDGKRDVLFALENMSLTGINGQIDKWILLLQGPKGKFTKLDIWQHGIPLWRRNRRNYWLSDRVETSEKLGSKYWIYDLFELKGERFVNVGQRFGFPRLGQFVGRTPKLTKKLRKEITAPSPGTVMELLRW